MRIDYCYKVEVEAAAEVVEVEVVVVEVQQTNYSVFVFDCLRYILGGSDDWGDSDGGCDLSETKCRTEAIVAISGICLFFWCFACCGGRIMEWCRQTFSSSNAPSSSQTSLHSWDQPEPHWLDNDGVFGANHEGENTPFVNGPFVGSYQQYNRSHPMKTFNLRFDGLRTVTGSGSDTVGDYEINGVYSNNTSRMQLNKTYIRGTGDPSENLGHTVKIRLEWNAQKNEFNGPWYVKTYKYEGTGSWIIRPAYYKHKKQSKEEQMSTPLLANKETAKYEGDAQIKVVTLC